MRPGSFLSGTKPQLHRPAAEAGTLNWRNRLAKLGCAASCHQPVFEPQPALNTCRRASRLPAGPLLIHIQPRGPSTRFPHWLRRPLLPANRGPSVALLPAFPPRQMLAALPAREMNCGAPAGQSLFDWRLCASAHIPARQARELTQDLLYLQAPYPLIDTEPVR